MNSTFLDFEGFSSVRSKISEQQVGDNGGGSAKPIHFRPGDEKFDKKQ
jgi:hypothetical protein